MTNTPSNKPNKAKCRLCGDTIESFHRHDYVRCTCGEIAVDGGTDYMRALAGNWDNFIRIDAEGREVKITLKNEEASTEQPETQTEPQPDQALTLPQKENALILIQEMIKSYEGLPQHAMHSMATNADVLSVLYLVRALFKSSGSIEE